MTTGLGPLRAKRKKKQLTMKSAIAVDSCTFLSWHRPVEKSSMVDKTSRKGEGRLFLLVGVDNWHRRLHFSWSTVGSPFHHARSLARPKMDSLGFEPMVPLSNKRCSTNFATELTWLLMNFEKIDNNYMWGWQSCLNLSTLNFSNELF